MNSTSAFDFNERAPEIIGSRLKLKPPPKPVKYGNRKPELVLESKESTDEFDTMISSHAANQPQFEFNSTAAAAEISPSNRSSSRNETVTDEKTKKNKRKRTEIKPAGEEKQKQELAPEANGESDEAEAEVEAAAGAVCDAEFASLVVFEHAASSAAVRSKRHKSTTEIEKFPTMEFGNDSPPIIGLVSDRSSLTRKNGKSNSSIQKKEKEINQKQNQNQKIPSSSQNSSQNRVVRNRKRGGEEKDQQANQDAEDEEIKETQVECSGATQLAEEKEIAAEVEPKKKKKSIKKGGIDENGGKRNTSLARNERTQTNESQTEEKSKATETEADENESTNDDDAGESAADRSENSVKPKPLIDSIEADESIPPLETLEANSAMKGESEQFGVEENANPKPNNTSEAESEAKLESDSVADADSDADAAGAGASADSDSDSVALLPRPVEELFSGIQFLLTGFDETASSHMSRRIQQHGGVMADTKKLTRNCNFFVICDQPKRTGKVLMALACGRLPVERRWIEKSIAEKKLLPVEQFQCETIKQGTEKQSIPIFKIDENLNLKPESHSGLLAVSTRGGINSKSANSPLFGGFHFWILHENNEHGREFDSDWKAIVRLAGGKLIESEQSFKQLFNEKEKLDEKMKKRVIIVAQSEKCPIAPSIAGRVKKSAIPILSAVYLRESLIRQKFDLPI